MTRKRAAGVVQAAVLAAAPAAACLSEPGYQPASAVSFGADGTGAVVAGAGFALHFASGNGFHLPDALKLDGVDLLGHDPDARCFAESEAGFLIVPTPRISPDGAAPAVASQLVPVLRGPAVVQVKLDWTGQFACNRARVPGGSSTFTVFPDGRIVRHDTLDDANPDETGFSPAECACDPSGDALFTISSYWTLTQAPFRELYTSASPDGLGLPMPEQPNLGTACLDGGAFQVAVAWVPSEDRNSTTIVASGTLYGLHLRKVFRDSTIDPLAWSADTALLLERGGCKRALDRAEDYSVRPALTINGTSLTAPARDGIYGSDMGSGPPGVPVAGRHAELTGMVKSSFAVWLRFASPARTVRAKLTGATGPWYLPQQVDDQGWIVWFRDPLVAGQQISIDAE
ncbi:MAG TPA: hypothetical protein VFT22_23505 [Kofleriaceae bacterium]|nr:hypothetical protein [Kofleriaceae bacterium]